MHYKWLLIALVLTCTRLASSSNKRRKTEEEINDNSISYDDKEVSKTSLFSSLIQDATVPIFLVMGLASIASAFNSVSCLVYVF